MDKRRLTSTELVNNIRAGDAGAEAEFCRRYQGSVRRLLFRLQGDHTKADDITQDVLLTVLVKLRGPGIDHPARLSSYVHQTARFTLLGTLRAAPNVQLCENMDDHAHQVRVEQSLFDDEQRRLVAGLIDTLEVERDREVLRRSYFRGEEKHLICDSLSLSTTHFDRVISRARKRLRNVVETQPDDVRAALDPGRALMA